MNTKELVANLYGIRAGLSVISKDSDAINESNRIIEAKKQHLKQCKKEVSTANSQLADEQNKIKKHSDTVSNLKERIDKRNSEIPKEVAKKFLLFFPSVVALIIVLFIVAYIVDIVFTVMTMGIPLLGLVKEAEGRFYITLAVIIGVAVVASLFFVLCIIYAKTSEIKNFTERDRNELRENEIKLNHYKSTIRSCQAKVDVAISNKSKCESETNTLIQAETIKQAEITSHSKVIYNALCKTYGSLLMEQDWANIDLLIFYFITGRADNMKEALLLVDKERQTQRIVEAVTYASKQICSTFQETMSELGNMLEYNFEILNSNIESVASNVNTLHSGINTLNHGVAALNESNRKILKANELNTALIAKSQKNSDELIGELRHLKYKFQENHII